MFQLEPYVPPILVFLQYQLMSQVTSHVLFLLLHCQPGTPYLYIFALYRISLPVSVNLSHISSSLLSLSSHPVSAPLIRYTILALYKFICVYVYVGGLVQR